MSQFEFQEKTSKIYGEFHGFDTERDQEKSVIVVFLWCFLFGYLKLGSNRMPRLSAYNRVPVDELPILALLLNQFKVWGSTLLL